MAYLARSRKCDLITLAEELDLIPPENAKVIQLSDLIIKDPNYKEDIVKGLLARITSEREEYEKKSEEKERREFELKKMEFESAMSRNNNSTIITSSTKDPDLLKLMNRYEIQNDISVYLGLFERQIKLTSISKEKWVTYLLGLLPLEIVNVIAREPETHSNDYEYIKRVLLNRFRLSPEQFRQKFFAHRKENSASWRDYAFELNNFLEEWVTGLEISTFDSLKELIVIDQIRRKLPNDIREHFLDDLPKLVKIDDLINKLDDYESARNNLKSAFSTKHSSPETRKSFSQSSEINRYHSRITNYRIPNNFSRNHTQGGKNNYDTVQPQNYLQGSYRNLKCYTCGEFSHKSSNCPRRKDGPICFRCSAHGHKSDVCPMKDAKTVSSNCSNSNKIMKSVKIMGIAADALIDSGSEVCMISYNFYNNLGRPELTKDSITLSGINEIQ